jgi:hypothetical protein
VIGRPFGKRPSSAAVFLLKHQCALVAHFGIPQSNVFRTRANAMNAKQIDIYNAVSKAAVHQSRRELARALRRARQYGREFYKRCDYHASYVGWPMRKRPSGDWR